MTAPLSLAAAVTEPAAAQGPSSEGGTEAVRIELLRAAAALIARLGAATRPQLLSATVLAAPETGTSLSAGGPAGEIARLRTSWGELLVRTMRPLPAAGQVLVLRLPPLGATAGGTVSGAAAVTIDLARPLPATLLLPVPPRPPSTAPPAPAQAGPATGASPRGVTAGGSAPAPPATGDGPAATGERAIGTAATPSAARSGPAPAAATGLPGPMAPPGTPGPSAHGARHGAARPAGAMATGGLQGTGPPPVGANSLGTAALGTLEVAAGAASALLAARADRAAAAQPVAPALGWLTASEGGAGRAGFPVLEETIGLLRAMAPAAAEPRLTSTVPQPGPRLGAALLFLLAAMRGGDARGWLGEAPSRALEHAGRGDLVSRLGAELAAAGRPASEGLSGEWRSQHLPILYQGEWSSLRLSVQRRAGRGDGPEDVPGRDGQRFLVELELSRLGPLQLDGRVRQKRLDLALRSLIAFPLELRRGAAGVFGDALEAIGFHGAIRFQTGLQNWVWLRGDESASSGSA